MGTADPRALAPGAQIRSLMRRLDRATLSTGMAGDSGWPYGSLVMAATDQDGSPLMLLSDLAEHTTNLKADPRVCLLFDGTAGLAEPLTGLAARLSKRLEDEAADLDSATRSRIEAMCRGFARRGGVTIAGWRGPVLVNLMMSAYTS